MLTTRFMTIQATSQSNSTDFGALYPPCEETELLDIGDGNSSAPKERAIPSPSPGNSPRMGKRHMTVSKVKRPVYICVVFLKVGEIDTIKEQYAADILVKAKWREPELDHRDASIKFDWSRTWTPKLHIENTVGDPREHVFQMITYNEFGHAFLCEKRRVSGVFLENLELNHFPFDVQDLTITVSSHLPTGEIRLVNDPDDPHRVNKQSFVDEQEWYLYKHIETEQIELSYEYADPGSIRPALSVKCRAARRPAYFIWNIFLVTFLICSLSLVTFAVKRSLPQNRLQLTFTLVLTLVAFKFVINQCLPKISYLTYLLSCRLGFTNIAPLFFFCIMKSFRRQNFDKDKYVISSLFILTLICLWHGLVVFIEKISASFSNESEVYVIVAISVAYAGYNLGFVVMIYYVACKRRREMERKDREYLEKIHCKIRSKGLRARRMSQQTHQIREVRGNGINTCL